MSDDYPVGETELATARQSLLASARRYGVRLCSADLEDLVQDTMVRLLKHSGGPIEHRAGYVWRAAHNVLVDALRRDTAAKRDERLTVPLEGKHIGRQASPEEILVDRESLRELLRVCERTLPKAQYVAFVLARVLGLSGTEIAAACGVSRACAYSRLQRARRALLGAGIALTRGVQF